MMTSKVSLNVQREKRERERDRQRETERQREREREERERGERKRERKITKNNILVQFVLLFTPSFVSYTQYISQGGLTK